jgi:hypothetical protein
LRNIDLRNSSSGGDRLDMAIPLNCLALAIGRLKAAPWHAATVS